MSYSKKFSPSSPKGKYLKAISRGNQDEAYLILKEGRLKTPQTLEHPLLEAWPYAHFRFEILPVLEHFLNNGMTVDWVPKPESPQKNWNDYDFSMYREKIKPILGRRIWGEFNEEELIDFINGGMLNWAGTLGNKDQRNQVISFLEEKNTPMVWAQNWSPLHSALFRGDTDRAYQLIEKIPPGFEFNANSLIWCGLLSLKSEKEDKKQWNKIKKILELVLSSEALLEKTEGLLKRLLNQSSYIQSLWIETPWCQWKKKPALWVELFNEQWMDRPDLVMSFLDHPDFVKESQKSIFQVSYRGEGLPAYQSVLRKIGSLNDWKKYDPLLKKMEKKGATPWMGDNTPIGQISDSEYLFLHTLSPPEYYLKRWSDFKKNKGKHIGFAAKTAEDVWKFKDDQASWTIKDSEGNQLFTSWVASALKNKKLAFWIKQVWNSKKIKAPTQGQYQNLEMSEWVAGNSELSKTLWKKTGIPNSSYALNKAIESNNLWAVNQLIQSHPLLCVQWNGGLIESHFENKNKIQYVGYRYWNIFLDKTFKALALKGWEPTPQQWTLLCKGKEPDFQNKNAITSGQAQGLLLTLPITPPPLFQAENLAALFNLAIESESPYPPKTWWMSTSRTQGWHQASDIIQAFEKFPAWAKDWMINPQSCSLEQDAFLNANQGWSEQEWNLLEGWLALKRLNPANNQNKSDEQPKTPKMRL